MSLKTRLDRVAAALAPESGAVTVWVYFGFGTGGKPIQHRPGRDAVYSVSVPELPEWLPAGAMLVQGKYASEELSPEEHALLRDDLMSALTPSQARLVNAARHVVIISAESDSPDPV